MSVLNVNVARGRSEMGRAEAGIRQLLHRYVPANFHDPVGLAARLIRTGDPAAFFAMASAAAAAACTPFDLLLEPFERRYCASAPAPRHPLILVCGPPRSGTTVVYQTLVNHLRAAYFPNLTSLFPRSPLSAMRLFGRFLSKGGGDYHSFYGRTRGLGGTNDALYIWDRWLGPDRQRPAILLTGCQQVAMRQFFAAADELFQLPLVCKNNNLNASAHLVAECLKQAYFICLTRDRSDLAQSLYRARCDIHGAPGAAYGLTDSAEVVGTNSQATEDPIRSVCRQTLFFERLADQQREKIGKRRFWMVRYEDFCRDPASLVRRIAREILENEGTTRGPAPTSFARPATAKVTNEIAHSIDAELRALE